MTCGTWSTLRGRVLTSMFIDVLETELWRLRTALDCSQKKGLPAGRNRKVGTRSLRVKREIIEEDDFLNWGCIQYVTEYLQRLRRESQVSCKAIGIPYPDYASNGSPLGCGCPGLSS